MKILVSDTSVLIDLERGSFLDSCFKLPFEFAVPDLLYKRELAEFGGPKLVELGLRVEVLSGDEVTIAQTVRTAHPKLSLPDAFAYTLASARRWSLLTGDGELRALAKAEKVPFFGVLWILDQLFDRSGGHCIWPSGDCGSSAVPVGCWGSSGAFGAVSQRQRVIPGF